MQTGIRTPPARRRYLPNSSLWTLCYKRMCVPWDTRHRGGTCFLVPYIRSTEVFGAPFPRSFGSSYINSGKECTTELLSLPEAGDCHSHFSSRTYSERRALKAMQLTGQSLRTHILAESSRTRVVPTCLESQQHQSQSQSLWTYMRWQLSRR
jgi:hypothetical protein